MKKLSGRYAALLIEGIMFVIFNILAWTLVDLKTANVFFYCGYAFLCVAFVLTACVLFFLKMGKNTFFSVMTPAYIFSGVYFFISAVMNIIFMALPDKTNTKAVVIPNVILVLLYVAAIIIAYVAISHIGNNNKVIDQKVATLKTTAIEIGQIAAIAEDESVKKSLLALREAVEYSDPMGVDGTASYEDDFRKKLVEIRLLVEEKYDADMIMNKITAANNKLRERNEILRTLK